MSILRDLRASRALKQWQLDPKNYPPERRIALLRDLDAAARARMKRRGARTYATYTNIMGEVLFHSNDPSRALAPFGQAYFTATIAGDTEQRAIAGEGLTGTYAYLGDYRFAAEMALEVLTLGDAVQRIQAPDLLLYFCMDYGHVDPDDSLYDILSEVLSTSNQTPTIASMQSILRQRVNPSSYDYGQLHQAVEPLLGSGSPDMLSLANWMLAQCALQSSAPLSALQHAEAALRGAGTDQPWLGARAWGLIARAQADLGRVPEAAESAVRGIASGHALRLLCSNDYARMQVSALTADATGTGMRLAANLADWGLLSELMENERLQAVPGLEYTTATESAEFADWFIQDLPKFLVESGSRPAIQAIMSTDWHSGLAAPLIASWGGSQTLYRAVQDSLVTGELTGLQVVDGMASTEAFRSVDGVVWLASIQDGLMHWTVTGPDGNVEGGTYAIPTVVKRNLAALNRLILADCGGDEQQVDPTRSSIDVLSALARAGSPEELQLLTPLADLVPWPIRSMVSERTSSRPLRVLFSPPAELACVPWSVLPVLKEGNQSVRMLERADLRFLTPTAIRQEVASDRPRIDAWRLALSVSNPAGDLRDWPPVIGDMTLAGSRESGDRVSTDQFLQALHNARLAPGSVVFVRSHLGLSSLGHIADEGIAFAYGILSARDIVKMARRSGGLFPERVILALCQGVGAADSVGLTLGLATAVRLSGAHEIVASGFDVIDSEWSCDFDHRLAAMALDPRPLADSLRLLQLECLEAWRTATYDESHPPHEGPTPLVWAAYTTIV